MFKSPFVVVRFAGGSAGKFVSSMLQTSQDIACWDPEVEQYKGSDQFESKFIKYVDNSFTFDAATHLRNEPDLPYQFDFYSGTFDRGTDITYDQYCKFQTDDYFEQNLHNNKFVNLILHKSKIPEFMKDAVFVNIIINSDRALDWAQKMLWLKHYEVIDQNTVKRKHHDPDTCTIRRSHLIKKYFTGSPLVTVSSVKDFFNQEIVHNPEFELFSSSEKLLEDQSNAGVTNFNFYLDNIFNSSDSVKNIQEILEEIGATVPTQSLLMQTYQSWWHKQCYILKQYHL